MKKKEIQAEACRALTALIAKGDTEKGLISDLFDLVWNDKQCQPTDREEQWFADEINAWYWKIKERRTRLES